MAAMNYDSYLDAMRRLVVADLGQADETFERLIPRMIESAELRIYRDMDLLVATVATEGAMTAGSRNIAVPSGIVIVRAINVVTPAATTADNGTRVPLERVSLAFIDATWPSALSTGVPAKYAMLTDTAVRFAPTPNAAYKAEFIGTFRPTALAASNATTFLTANLPDLMVAASMVYYAGAQRDYGAQSDDPKVAVSWLQQYETLKAAANAEELRRRAGAMLAA